MIISKILAEMAGKGVGFEVGWVGREVGCPVGAQNLTDGFAMR